MASEPKKEKISKWAQFKIDFMRGLPMLLAHHPFCHPYDQHTIPIGKYKLCIGCFIGYGSAILMGSLYFFWLSKIIEYPPLTVFLIGLLAMQTQFLSFTHITEKRFVKIIQKFFMGGGGGLCAASFFLWLPIEQSNFRQYITFFTIIFISVPMWMIHGRNLRKICNACENKWVRGKCPTGYCFADRPKGFNEFDPSTYPNPSPNNSQPNKIKKIDINSKK